MRHATLVAVGCVALMGCGGGRGHHGGGADFPTGAVATAVIAAAEVAAYAASPRPVPDPDPDPDPYIGSQPGPPPPLVINSAHPNFEPVPALAAIDALDFASCHSSGTLIGWNHARLTFQRDGAVSRVQIDWTPGMPPAAVECLRAQLASVSVPPFEGPPVTIGAAFFVP